MRGLEQAPEGAHSVVARDPTFAGPVSESDVIECTFVWLDADGHVLDELRVGLDDAAMPLPVLNAALRKFSAYLAGR